jgi:hypothetical protein
LVHTTANGRRPFGSFRYLAGLSGISLSRTAALRADRSVENSRRAVAAVIPSSNSRWKAMLAALARLLPRHLRLHRIVGAGHAAGLAPAPGQAIPL